MVRYIYYIITQCINFIIDGIGTQSRMGLHRLITCAGCCEVKRSDLMIISIFPAKCKVCYKKQQIGLSATPPTINNTSNNNSNNNSNNINNSNNNNNSGNSNNNNNNLPPLTAANITTLATGHLKLFATCKHSKYILKN